MGELYGGTQLCGSHPRTKAEMVAQSANLLLMEIVNRCCQGVTHKHYFDIGAIGYSSKGAYSLLSSGRWLLSPSEMAATVKKRTKILRRSIDPNGVAISYYAGINVWIEPHSDGTTPMNEALSRVSEILHTWTTKHKNGFPPTIINITDGDMTDANREEILKKRDNILKLGTTDGEPIIMNFHISSSNSDAVMFPTTKEELPNEAHLLYDLSSPLPQIYTNHIASLKNQTGVENTIYRAVSYNLPVSDLIKAMQIGTTTTEQLHL